MEIKCDFCGKEAGVGKRKILINGKYICFDCWIEDRHKRDKIS
ncbi:hypothetical protein [Alkaliphilus pronyensis]|nr:hypothetical protein [Alkaliphilus pronyensis]